MYMCDCLFYKYIDVSYLYIIVYIYLNIFVKNTILSYIETHFIFTKHFNINRQNTLKATKDATTDCTVILSSKKAKELSIKEGDIIGIIGRRRRATYAIATIQKAPKSVASLSYNLANNLRVREGDKVKIVKLGTGAEEKEERSGDMELLTQDAPIVSSVTYSPIEDSLNSLIASEGGDEIEDEELMDRFLTPYLNLEDGVKVTAKEGNVLTIRDENGKFLDFMVSHVDVGEESEGRLTNELFDMQIYSQEYHTHLNNIQHS
jgi:hypothetical protein